MAANTTQVNVLSYSSTNVSTSAYVQLIASTPISTAHLQITDTSGEILKLATGVAGSEVDICTVPPSADGVLVPYYIPAGSSISIRAINTSATSGYNVLSLIPW